MPAAYSSLRSPSLRFWPPPAWVWLLVLAAGLFWSFVFVACYAGSWHTPQEQAFMAGQYHAACHLLYPDTAEFGSIREAQVLWLGQRCYEVHAWIGGTSRAGYPQRQAFVARVYAPPGARRFEEWQLLDFRFE